MDVLRADTQEQIGAIDKPAPTPRPPVPVGVYAHVLLFRGSDGPQVAQLQRQLRQDYAAYAGHLVVDGIYGPQTEAAVREFQRRTRGLKVDGVVGPLTAAAMKLRLVPPVQAARLTTSSAGTSPG
jgi:peptidoglycan hydrolase-like protein with peptidoglycan-binding domain